MTETRVCHAHRFEGNFLVYPRVESDGQEYLSLKLLGHVRINRHEKNIARCLETSQQVSRHAKRRQQECQGEHIEAMGRLRILNGRGFPVIVAVLVCWSSPINFLAQ